MRRRRACAVGASVALHAGALVAALLLLSRERELGALFIDLTRWSEPGAAGASVTGGGAAPGARPAASPRAGVLRHGALSLPVPGPPRAPLPRVPAERRAEALRVEPASASPSPGEPESPPTRAAVAAPQPAPPAATRESSAGDGMTAAHASSEGGAGGSTVYGGGGIGIGGRGGGGGGTVPDVSHGMALAVPGAGGGARPETEYGPYLMRLRRRVQESLRYPPAARRRGLEGIVAIEIVIRPDGTLGAVTLAHSSAHAVLDDAAIEAVRRLAPEPFPSAVAPRVLRVRLPVVFALE